MTTVGVMMCRDELDVIAGVIRHMSEEVDHLIVADNGSKDGTREVLDELAEEVSLWVLDDPIVAYEQSKKMTHLAVLAAEQGAEWIVPFDADEIWYAHSGRIREVLAGASKHIGVVEVPMWNHYASGVDDLDVPDPFQRLVHRWPEPGALPKVAFRWEECNGETPVIHQGNHGVTLACERKTVSNLGLEIRHFPYRSWEQMVRKARNGAEAYAAATDLPHDMGQHWREYGVLLERGGEQVLHDVYDQHFSFPVPSLAGLAYDPAPYRRWNCATDDDA